MLIQCRQERKDGTVIELDKSKYHFKPNADGAHVCEVKDRKHIDTLLSIVEGFHVHGEEPEDIEAVDEDIDSDESDAPPANPADWSNKQCNEWAKKQGFNPLNKTQIEKFAKEKGVELDRSKSPANMIKDIAASIWM
jgi:hypothetical protein